MSINRNRLVNIVELWKSFIPLSLTDMAMAFGEPVRNFAMAKLPQADLSIASIGIAKNLAVFFESPIIMILHTSNALSRDGNSSRLLLRFTLIFSLILSIAFLVIGLPDIFHFIATNIFSLEVEVATTTRRAIGMLFLWPFIIGWRRYFQGLLIQNSKNAVVASASMVRLVFVVGLPLLGIELGWSGVVCAVSSLIVGIIVESLYVTFYSLKFGILKQTLKKSTLSLPQSYKELIKYYFPLAISMIVIWGTRALIVFQLSYAIDSKEALVIWPVVWGFVIMISNGTRMVQQVYMASKNEYAKEDIQLFVLSVGLVFSLMLVVLAMSPMGHSMISYGLGNIEHYSTPVLNALVWFAVFPFLTTLQNVMQGELILSNQTKTIGRTAWLSNALIMLLAYILLKNGVTGAISLCVALNVGLACEILCYSFALKKKFKVK